MTMDPTPPLDIWLLLEREREGEESDRRDPLSSRVLSTYRSLLNTHEQASKIILRLHYYQNNKAAKQPKIHFEQEV